MVKTSPHLPPTTLCLKALYVYAIWTAWQTFGDAMCGSLVPGIPFLLELLYWGKPVQHTDIVKPKSFMNYLSSCLFEPPFSTFVNTLIADRREHHVSEERWS